jgi:hypothetical protein
MEFGPTRNKDNTSALGVFGITKGTYNEQHPQGLQRNMYFSNK